MDIFSLVRMVGALGVVLGILASGLWVLRRYNIKLPGGLVGDDAKTRVALVERVGLDARRSIVLVRRDGREHLILIAPEGHLVVESAIVRDVTDAAAAASRSSESKERAVAAEFAAAQAQANFRELVGHVLKRSSVVLDRVGAAVEKARAARPAARPAGSQSAVATLPKARARAKHEGPASRATGDARPGAAALGKGATVKPRPRASRRPKDRPNA